jgi:hypothetical protein
VGVFVGVANQVSDAVDIHHQMWSDGWPKHGEEVVARHRPRVQQSLFQYRALHHQNKSYAVARMTFCHKI